MLARFQQILVLLVLSAASACAAALWQRSVWWAGAAFLVVVFAYSGLLALQFVLMRVVNRTDTTPRASLSQTLSAWLSECAVAVCVFCWWQPFRSSVYPDSTTGESTGATGRGVVLLHGFVCNRGLWTPWLRELQRRDIRFVAVNLEPAFASIDAYAAQVDAAVRQIAQATGQPPLLVCHSMGGLVARAWLRAGSHEGRVHHVVTLGSPHHGTRAGDIRFSLRALVNAGQMCVGSSWLRELARDEPASRHRLFTCFYSNCDNIVFPASTATLLGADNRLVPGCAHLALVLDRSVMAQTLALL